MPESQEIQLLSHLGGPAVLRLETPQKSQEYVFGLQLIAQFETTAPCRIDVLCPYR